MLVTAPAELREQLEPLTGKTALIRHAAPPCARADRPRRADRRQARPARLARRWLDLDAEIADHDADLDRPDRRRAPRSWSQRIGIGPDTAAEMLVARRRQPRPDPLRSRLRQALRRRPDPRLLAARPRRHRLNRGGNRQANAALYRIVIVRMRYHQPTQDYVARRTAEGKTKTRDHPLPQALRRPRDLGHSCDRLRPPPSTRLTPLDGYRSINALMETINGLYKAECIRTTVFHDGPYKTIADVEYATAGWVDWYNNRRLHSTLGMIPRSSTSKPTTLPSTESRTPYRSGREPGALQLTIRMPTERGQPHHRLKHHGGWTLTMAPTGTATWTNGIGQQYLTHPPTTATPPPEPQRTANPLARAPPETGGALSWGRYPRGRPAARE